MSFVVLTDAVMDVVTVAVCGVDVDILMEVDGGNWWLHVGTGC